jgi:cob(I)alamin adenosyltransferase
MLKSNGIWMVSAMREYRASIDGTQNYDLPQGPKNENTGHCSKSRWQRKIYTRTGDRGETSLLNGGRVPKHYPRIEANGMIDELNSWIGYVRSINRDKAIDALLADLQPRLNILCSDIAAPMGQNGSRDRFVRIQAQWAHDLEAGMTRMEEELEMLNHPVLPGGSPAAASLHLARTVCRRAELTLWAVQDAEENVNPEAIRFLNRLSDFLFLLAQWANLRFLKGDA